MSGGEGVSDAQSQSMNPDDREGGGDASLTGNEFEEPGANYPDSAKETDEEPRIAGVAEDLPPEQRTGTQDGPRQDVHVTNDQERLHGIIAQTRIDLTGQSPDIVEKSLRHRLGDIGITLDEDEFAALVRDISGGGAG